ncbi:MAG: anti-sigma factor [Acidobacteriota bacterium]
MTCDELRDEYGAYALGIAENPELSELASHLERSCPVCVPGVRSALATVAAMSGGVKSVAPPKRLRARVVAMVAPAPKRFRTAVWLPWAVSAALAIVLLSVVLPARLHRPETPSAGSARLNEILSVLNDPATRDVAFGDPAARGRFFVNPDKGVVFIAAHLPLLDAGRTFEMWVIPPDGQPVPAGVFQALSDSTAVHVRPGPVGNAAALAISIEPAGGSPQPTTTPIIVTKL